MTESHDLYRVVVFSNAPDLTAIRDLLVRTIGLTHTDAMIHARHAPGLLPDRLTHERAAAVVAGLSELGHLAEVIAERELPRLDHVEAVHHVRCLDSGLEVIEYHGAEERVVAWPAIRLISVGSVPDNESRRFVASPTTFAGPHHSTSSIMVHRSPGPVAWIVCKPDTDTLTIDHAKMNYEDLGPRMTDSATANFRLFLSDLVGRATQAVLTPAARAFLDHQPSARFNFDSADELLRYTVFQEIVRRREACERQKSEGGTRNE